MDSWINVRAGGVARALANGGSGVTGVVQRGRPVQVAP